MVVGTLKQNYPRWTSNPDMQKNIFFTPTWLEQKIFYPIKCVNNDKSNLQQNRVNGQKNKNSANKYQKSDIQFQNVLKKMPPKNAKLCHYSL